MSSGVCPWLQGQAWGRCLSKSLIFHPLYDLCNPLFSGRCTHLIYRNKHRTSLVAQWLRICLPMQGMPVQSLDREDFTCCASTDLSTTTTGTHTPQSARSAEGAAPAQCNESPHEAMKTQCSQKRKEESSMWPSHGVSNNRPVCKPLPLLSWSLLGFPQILSVLRNTAREFSGSPVVRTQSFHCHKIHTME